MIVGAGRGIAVVAVAAWLFAAPAVCVGQSAASDPKAQPGGTIVVNPTEAECKRGWSADLRWTEEQFRSFCERLETSK
jgi:hypothetical protein